MTAYISSYCDECGEPGLNEMDVHINARLGGRPVKHVTRATIKRENTKGLGWTYDNGRPIGHKELCAVCTEREKR